MKQKEVPYEIIKQEFIDELKKLGKDGLYKRGILATSQDGYVTARRMKIVPSGLTLYCITTKNMRKCEQIAANPRVAVVVGFMQYEGEATLEGDPIAVGNEDYIRAHKDNDPVHYESYKHNFGRPNFEIELIKIVPRRITLRSYKPEDGLDILDVVDGKAYRVSDLLMVKEDHSDAPIYSQSN